MNSPRLSILATAAAILLLACQKPAATTSQANAPPAPVVGPSGLKNVATKYDVTYTPETVVLSAETAEHHLKSQSEDGVSFTFDAQAADVKALKPGSVMILPDIALRRVTQVQSAGDSVVVQTTDAQITDAIQDGHITANPTIDFGSMALAPAPANDGWSLIPAAYADVVTSSGPLSFTVSIDPYTYNVKFSPAGDRLNIEMTVAGTVDKMSVTAKGYIKNYRSLIDMVIQNKTITNMDFENSNLEGDMTVTWTAATVVAGPLTKIASWTDLLKKYQPLRQSAFTFPFAIGPIPFTIKFSTGITLTPAFTSKNSAMQGSLTVHYSGNGGFTVNHGSVSTSGSFTQPSQANPTTSLLSIGPVGFTVAVEFPRAELGMGLAMATFSPTAYINAVSSFGLVYGGPASMLPCETHLMAVAINTGISSSSTILSLFGTPTKLQVNKELYKKDYKGPGAKGLAICPS